MLATLVASILRSTSLTCHARCVSSGKKTRKKVKATPEPWLQRIRTSGRASVKSWSKNINDSQTHKLLVEAIRIEGKLPAGAYLLEAKSGSLSARELILVTDATLVLKSSMKQALVFFADAYDGRAYPKRRHRALGKLSPG